MTATLAPFRVVVAHRGADDRLACGHTVPAHGLVAAKRRCRQCARAAYPLTPAKGKR